MFGTPGWRDKLALLQQILRDTQEADKCTPDMGIDEEKRGFIGYQVQMRHVGFIPSNSGHSQCNHLCLSFVPTLLLSQYKQAFLASDSCDLFLTRWIIPKKFPSFSTDYYEERCKEVKFGLLRCRHLTAFRKTPTSDTCVEVYLLLPRVNFYTP